MAVMFTDDQRLFVYLLLSDMKKEDEARAKAETGKLALDVDDGGTTRSFFQDEVQVSVDQIHLVSKCQCMNCFCCGEPIERFDNHPRSFAVGRLFDDFPSVFANVVVVHACCRGIELQAARRFHGWKIVERLRRSLRTPMLRVAVSGRVNLSVNHWPTAPSPHKRPRKPRTYIDVINGILASKCTI